MDAAKVIKVGVTGGIGSGKSTVCRLFVMLGARLYDSDARAKELMAAGGPLENDIRRAFGDKAYAGGELDRAYLASEVFGNAEKLRQLNGIVHPAVLDDFRQWARQADAPAGYVIMESAIIFEAGFRQEVDCVVTVSAPEELRVDRVTARDGVSREKAMARVRAQMDDAERESLSDYIIKNDGQSLVWEQVLELDAIFRAQARRR